jgi:hypothetical protein
LIDGLILVICVFVVLAAYLAIIAATREGDAAFISMFRYTRMVFALIVGVVFLHERPDTLTLIGVAIVMGGGPSSVYGAQALSAYDEFAQADHGGSDVKALHDQTHKEGFNCV